MPVRRIYVRLDREEPKKVERPPRPCPPINIPTRFAKESRFHTRSRNNPHVSNTRLADTAEAAVLLACHCFEVERPRRPGSPTVPMRPITLLLLNSPFGKRLFESNRTLSDSVAGNDAMLSRLAKLGRICVNRQQREFAVLVAEQWQKRPSPRSL